MDERRLATLVRRWLTRRAVVRTWLGAAGIAVVGTAERSLAARCLAAGEECRRGRQCCSGRCRRRRCRPASGQGTCSIRKNTCRDVGSPLCGTTGGSGGCSCHVTTRGTSFCGAGLACRAGGICTKDSDCDSVFGPGSACVRDCCAEQGGVACVARCANPD
jgi:hypothetical protein